jgi:hypothetical protein
VVGHGGFGGGLFERFNVLKRLVVAEIGEIDDSAVETVALATGARFRSCPKAEWN